MSSGPKKVETRGGFRPGAGRKRIYELSEAERRRVIRAVRRELKAKRKSPGSILGELLLSDDARQKAVGLQIYFRDVLARSSEQEINVNKGPGIYLPNERPDPTAEAQARASEEGIYLPQKRPDPAAILPIGKRVNERH